MTDPDTTTSPPLSLSEVGTGSDPTTGPSTEAVLNLVRTMTGPARTRAPEASDAVALPPAASLAVVVAEFVGLGADGAPLVRLPGHAEAVRARSVVALPARLEGRQVLVVHETNRHGAPIVTGVLREDELPAPAALPSLPPGAPFELEVDGERVVLMAQHQLILRCGDASLTLTRDGKILLRGTYVSSRSSGVHRIHGAAVEIN
jgi:Domain of unknown function (DUF6484)